MIEAIIQRGTLLTIGVLIICVFGLLAVFRVPVQLIPDLELRVVSVRTFWPDATPQDVEKEILIEQEEYLRDIPNMRRMVSTAGTGEARIELEFPYGTDINEALIRVNNALSQVPSYPENVDEPRLYTTSYSTSSFMFFRIEPLPGNPKGVDMDFMRDYIDDNVRTRMERVPGISQAEIRGGAKRQVQIYVDPERLAERGITLTGLRNVIRERNQDISAGQIDSGKRRYLLRTVGRFNDLRELEELVIRRDGDSIIRLKDVAHVRIDHFDVVSEAYVNGEPIIMITLRRETGSNVIETKNAILPIVEQISKEVLEPAGMRMLLTTDDVRYVEDSVKNVWQNLILGTLLVTVVIFLFLRSTTATLISVLGIPICTIAAFLGLLLAGRTINVISLAGVAFAIGMTLDNTIVVLESIEQERRKGLGRLQAAIIGTRKVWMAVLASTLTTVIVFAPILFVKEEAGQLYSDIAIAVTASILVSMLVAMTVIPNASSRLAFGSNTTQKGFGDWVNAHIIATIHWFVSSTTKRLSCIILTFAVTAWAIIALTPPAEYLPEGEEPKLFSTMIAPPGYSLNEMSKLAEDLHKEFLPYLDDEPEQFKRGESEVPALRYFMLWTMSQQLRVIAEAKDPGDIDAVMEMIDKKFEQYPGMRAFSSRGSIISSNDGGTRSVNVDISGADLQSIYSTAYTAYQRAKTIFANPRINSEPASLILGQPLLELRPRWERVAELNLDAAEIGYTVSAITDGAYVDEFFLSDDKIDMYIYSASGNIDDIEQIKNIPIYTSMGNVIPVGAVADLIETVDTDTIRRVNGRRTITLRIIAPDTVALETAIDTVQTDLINYLKDTGQAPSSVTFDISGASDQLDATRAAVMDNFLIALLLCYLVMVAIFSHWGYPLVIMTTVPLGIAGGIGGLWLLNHVGAQLPLLGLPPINQPYDMITMLGFLILVGTVVNNPVLIVDVALKNINDAGLSAVDAVCSAVDLRLRPIMITTISNIFGLIPLVFIPGAGTELYRGLSAIVLFGLFFATIVTLVFLPSLLITVFNLRERFANKKPP